MNKHVPDGNAHEVKDSAAIDPRTLFVRVERILELAYRAFREQGLDEDLERAFKQMSANTKRKAYVEFLRKKASKPDFYPAIRTCHVANGEIYVITYLKEDSQSECLIYDMKGKRLKRVFIPIRDISPLMLPLFTIHGSRLYQLIENEEKEVWQLVIDKIN